MTLYCTIVSYHAKKGSRSNFVHFICTGDKADPSKSFTFQQSFVYGLEPPPTKFVGSSPIREVNGYVSFPLARKRGQNSLKVDTNCTGQNLLAGYVCGGTLFANGFCLLDN